DDDTKRRLWRYKSDIEEGPDEEKLLQLLGKLQRLPVTISILQETSIGKVVNKYRKQEGLVGVKAKKVVDTWKSLVEKEVHLTESKNSRKSSPEPQPGRSDKSGSSKHRSHRDEKSHHRNGYKHHRSERSDYSNVKVKQEKTEEVVAASKSARRDDSSQDEGAEHSEKGSRTEVQGNATSEEDEDTRNRSRRPSVSENEEYEPTRVGGRYDDASHTRDSDNELAYKPSKINKYEQSESEEAEDEPYDPGSGAQLVAYVPQKVKEEKLSDENDSENRYVPSKKSLKGQDREEEVPYVPSKRSKDIKKEKDEEEYVPSKVRRVEAKEDKNKTVTDKSTSSSKKAKEAGRHGSAHDNDEDLTDSDEAYCEGEDSHGASKIEDYYKAMLAQAAGDAGLTVVKEEREEKGKVRSSSSSHGAERKKGEKERGGGKDAKSSKRERDGEPKGKDSSSKHSRSRDEHKDSTRSSREKIETGESKHRSDRGEKKGVDRKRKKHSISDSEDEDKEKEIIGRSTDKHKVSVSSSSSSAKHHKSSSSSSSSSSRHHKHPSSSSSSGKHSSSRSSAIPPPSSSQSSKSKQQFSSDEAQSHQNSSHFRPVKVKEEKFEREEQVDRMHGQNACDYVPSEAKIKSEPQSPHYRSAEDNEVDSTNERKLSDSEDEVEPYSPTNFQIKREESNEEEDGNSQGEEGHEYSSYLKDKYRPSSPGSSAHVSERSRSSSSESSDESESRQHSSSSSHKKHTKDSTSSPALSHSKSQKSGVSSSNCVSVSKSRSHHSEPKSSGSSYEKSSVPHKSHTSSSSSGDKTHRSSSSSRSKDKEQYVSGSSKTRHDGVDKLSRSENADGRERHKLSASSSSRQRDDGSSSHHRHHKSSVSSTTVTKEQGDPGLSTGESRRNHHKSSSASSNHKNHSQSKSSSSSSSKDKQHSKTSSSGEKHKEHKQSPSPLVKGTEHSKYSSTGTDIKHSSRAKESVHHKSDSSNSKETKRDSSKSNVSASHKSSSSSSSHSSSNRKKRKLAESGTTVDFEQDFFSDAVLIKPEPKSPIRKAAPRSTSVSPTPPPSGENFATETSAGRMSNSHSSKKSKTSEAVQHNKDHRSKDHSRKHNKVKISTDRHMEVDLDEVPADVPEDPASPEETDAGMSFEDFLNFDEVKFVKKGKSSSKSSQKSPRQKLTPNSSSSGLKTGKSERAEVRADRGGSSSLSSASLSVPKPSNVVSSMDILGALPEPRADYKPLRFNPYFRDEPEHEMSAPLVDPDEIGTKIQVRTQVYSGRKHGVTEVKSLYDLCMQVLIENIDAIDYVGGIPYSILKPVLERSTAQQLYQLEDFNPHFLEDSDELWESLCHREFRGSRPDEMESWRELYLRRHEERQEKYQKLKASMSASIVKGQAGRKAKLAFVDSVAKPPREVLRQQKRFGTSCIIRTKGNPNVKGSSSGLKQYRPSTLVPAHNPMDDRARMMKATPPMMAKALQMRKNMRR
ncbi:serine-rich adhesin for platelets, partial [Aplysia californica]|uniref:Serine-rich adhesin for platelets n=1 Tax=Aplysia californica TaxID=6500 RepID=A0ABM1A6V3_APLCA